MAYSIDRKKFIILFCMITLFVIAVRGCVYANSTESLLIEQTNQLVFDDTVFISMYDDDSGDIIELGLEEYVFGVVAGEMPASYELEALKAQAVAARTFTAMHLEELCGDDAAHCSVSGADICSDSGCCQAWKSNLELRERWGRDYCKYAVKVYNAVNETRGVIAVYDGDPIQALYHASSGGETEDCENVFSNTLPYLKGVESPGEEYYAHYSDEEVFELKDFVERLNEAFSSADLTLSNARDSVSIVSRYGSGRVERVKVGDTHCSGRDFRTALDLYSAYFTIEFNGDSVIITTKGYGHGVGMSQSGANAMAREGASYTDIIRHYYTDVELLSING